MHRWWLLALCYIGVLTHPLLDLQTTYSVQLFSPLSARWHHSDGLFIIDMWLWVLAVIAIAASQAREVAGRSDWGRPVGWALVIAVFYICLNIGFSDSATHRLRTARPNATAIFASPPPVRFWERNMAWREGDGLGQARWTFAGGLGDFEPVIDDGMNDSTLRSAIRQSPGLRRFLRWSVLPLATVRREGCTAIVSLGDGRYRETGARNSRLSRDTRIDVCA